ncbi:uncharacterized protein MYCFIDRAFT_200933 [Pseudocercospora fijiensis CIRAD86]|uniref:Uncharacterized protein n=1 Tax=Pseudocercospora fijiensis (strain CIRAD86) TaxID=383855 RepID=M3AIA9_PSEFD|nr:uncharacterized protein MYCFIDRAFT_200933 [Pseudocercospora fijiensis CIRAD86]EME76943.1 hypothetical protein MYCFIDRAFT_200933 [Pseudocercospora fijiensis CIRAD86]
MARRTPASFADLPVEMVSWVSDRIKHKEDLLSFCRVNWESRNNGVRTLLNRMRGIYIEPTAASFAKFKTIVQTPAVASRIQTIIYLQTFPPLDPKAVLQQAEFHAERKRHQCTIAGTCKVIWWLQDHLKGFSMEMLKECLIEAVEHLPNLQHIAIAASPAAVEYSTMQIRSGDLLNRDSRWLVNEEESRGASSVDKLWNFVLWNSSCRASLDPLLEAMAHHADFHPEVQLNLTFQGGVPVGTEELLEFAQEHSVTFNKAMAHIKDFIVHAAPDHQGHDHGPFVQSPEAYESMLSALVNIQMLKIITNKSAVQQAGVLGELLRHPNLHFRKLQKVQFYTLVPIFDPEIAWIQQELVPFLPTAQQLLDFLCRHKTTLEVLALDSVSGVRERNPQGLQIEGLERLLLQLRKRFGKLWLMRVTETVIYGDRDDEIGLPYAQILKREARDEALSGLGKLSRKLGAWKKVQVCSKMSDGTLVCRDYSEPPNGTDAVNDSSHGASAAEQPSREENSDIAAAQTAAGIDATAVQEVSTHDSNDDNDTEANARDANPTLVSEHLSFYYEFQLEAVKS